jgi:hypothetical protein
VVPYGTAQADRPAIRPKTIVSFLSMVISICKSNASPVPADAAKIVSRNTLACLPLYVARIEDLERGDLVKTNCTPCYHVARLSPEVLMRAGLNPGAKVLDLKDSALNNQARKHGGLATGGSNSNHRFRGPPSVLDLTGASRQGESGWRNDRQSVCIKAPQPRRN